MEPSVGRIAGQLSYLFEERPELRRASAEQLAARLDHEDRFARAREKYPLVSDDEVKTKVSEFESRITAGLVRQALDQLAGSS
jgi:hypothetical protein